MTDCKPLNRCLCCGSGDLKPTLDLGSQPLANSFKATPMQRENSYPLAVNYCPHCHHLQLTHAVDANIIFKDYVYVSGTSLTMQEYFKWFAAFVMEYFQDVPPRRALEIGCNDGTQLNYFKKYGLETWGIDPAENIYPISSKNHNIICDFLSKDALEKLKRPVDIIYAQNVFAHQDNPQQFLELCKSVMNPNTLLFIQNSQSDMIQNNEFDTIYHEHRNFFSVSSLNTLANNVGLHLIDVVKGTIHGGSNIFVFSTDAECPARVKGYMDWERIQGLYNHKTYQDWAEGAKRTVNDLSIVLDAQRKAHNRVIVGYGAPAKGNTLLNFGNISLDFIIDDNPLKQNKYTPGMSIPVVSIEHLQKYVGADICFVPLAWNFFDEIVNRLRAVRNNSGDVFVRYFPSIQIQ